MTIPAPHHADPRQSELFAAKKVKPHVETLKAKILRLMAESGQAGLIPDEVDGLINTIRRRFTELWKDGFIKPTDRMRANTRGNPETVWVLGRDPVLRVTRGKPVEADIVHVEPLNPPLSCDKAQRMRIVVYVTRDEWERVPSPARVRFI